MQEIIYTKGYESLKTELKAELSRATESFVRIGYLLKVARDTNVLSESPYSNMEEFAFAEFKIDKGTASKFMNINDRFSEGGYSDRLKTEYSGIGWSKLSIMLQIPDSINEEITAGFSKSEIQAIRDEVAAAEKETPLETMLDGETAVTAQAEDILDKAIRQLGESEYRLYVQIHDVVIGEEKEYDLEDIKSIMAPSGEMIYSIRIRGVGRMMLSCKDYEDTVVIVNERSGEKEVRTWNELAQAWTKLIDVNMAPEKDWECIYDMSYPGKTEVAPVQQPKKVVKVNDTPKKKDKKPEKPEKTKTEPESEQRTLHDIDESIPEPVEPEPVKEEKEEEEPVIDDTEPLPGQVSIEDMPEVQPEKVEGEVVEPDRDETGVDNALRTINTLWNGNNPHKISLMLDVVEELRETLRRLGGKEE